MCWARGVVAFVQLAQFVFACVNHVVLIWVACCGSKWHTIFSRWRYGRIRGGSSHSINTTTWWGRKPWRCHYSPGMSPCDGHVWIRWSIICPPTTWVLTCTCAGKWTTSIKFICRCFVVCGVAWGVRCVVEVAIIYSRRFQEIEWIDKRHCSSEASHPSIHSCQGVELCLLWKGELCLGVVRVVLGVCDVLWCMVRVCVVLFHVGICVWWVLGGRVSVPVCVFCCVNIG